MTNPTTLARVSPPEWWRPVSDRFRSDDPGPPPWTVRAAALFAAAGALAAAGMVQIWGAMVLDGVELAVAAPLTAVGLTLLLVLGGGTVQISRRGWCRQPKAAGLVLGSLALIGFLSYAPALAGDGYLPETQQTALHVSPRLAAATVVGFGLAALLRSRSASDWLAHRRLWLQTRPEPGSAG